MTTGSTTPVPPVPSGGGLTFRPISTADLDAWVALIERIAAVEKPSWHPVREDLVETLESAKDDPRRDTVLGVDDAGEVRAYAQASLNPGGAKVRGEGGVDPGFQHRGIGTALLGWLQRRTRERFEERGHTPALLRIASSEDNRAAAALFAAQGFTVVRYFNEMIRPLAEPLERPEPPAGIRIEPFRMELSEALRLAHNEAFADHWGSEPKDAEAWNYLLHHPQARPDWSTVAVEEASGDVAGYQLSSYDPATLAERGRNEGYTELLGVRAKWRGRGLAPALLADALQRYQAAGMDHACLDVDSENPSGALRLYEGMGYRAIRRELVWDTVCDSGSEPAQSV